MKWFGGLFLAALAEARPQFGGGLGGGGGGTSGGYSLIRFGCSQVSLQRVDP